MTHPTRALDEVIHQKNRLGILAVLAEADFADFNYLKEVLDLTDGNLSRHLQVLEESGLVSIKKGFEGRKTRTVVKATRQGRKALGEHLRAMQQLIDRVGQKERSR
ncbi:MAG: winged helix-turn-helix domain-containing protein [Acidimicrobiia bacterium]